MEQSELEPELDDYLTKRSGHKVLIINIESVPALERLDDILSEPYVDAVLIGPHDLSCSLGLPEQWEHPVFDEAIRKIITTSRKHNVGIGIHHNYPNHEIEWIKAGS